MSGTRAATGEDLMLIRLLLWLALAAIVWWAFRHRRGRTHVRGPRADSGRLAKPEEMVDCARCGLHLPASETVRDAAGRRYCCTEHRDQGPLARG